jgi:hypothetical protein
MKVAKQPGNQANWVMYIYSTKLLKRLVTDLRTVTDFSTEMLNRFVGRMYSYESSKVFLDVGRQKLMNRQTIKVLKWE